MHPIDYRLNFYNCDKMASVLTIKIIVLTEHRFIYIVYILVNYNTWINTTASTCSVYTVMDICPIIY